jgi:hypothetical protein
MINRYAGEIHLNPMRILRNDDFNNDGRITDIEATLLEAIALTAEINDRLQRIKEWLENENTSKLQFHFAEGGYIGIKGLSDTQLKELAAQELIELFDFATNRDWVKKHGHQFGLIWEGGRAVEL